MVATFNSNTEYGLKIIYYNGVSFKEYSNRYQKEAFASQSEHTVPPLQNKTQSSATL